MAVDSPNLLRHRALNNKVKPDEQSFPSMKKRASCSSFISNAHFLKWRTGDVLYVIRNHSLPCVLAACMLFFMFVEYTLSMIPASHPPFDLGFILTRHLNLFLASRPNLNNLLAGLNTVFVAMQSGYIVCTWLIEGRPRALISALFMFTFRGISGYSTQLPLPKDFLGSGVDFPVGNVSFFLFYSGHVAASVIASLDMRRMQRWELAYIFDSLNVLQIVRLLSTRGHYTIDLIVGVGAGLLFNSIAGRYEKNNIKESPTSTSTIHGPRYEQNKTKESPTSTSTIDDPRYEQNMIKESPISTSTIDGLQHLTRGPQLPNNNGVHA